MTPRPGRLKIAIAPATCAGVAGAAAAAAVLLLPPDYQTALLVGWAVGAFTFLVARRH